MVRPSQESRPADPFARVPPELGARLRPLVPPLVEEVLVAFRTRTGSPASSLAPADADRLRRALAAGLHAFLDRVEDGGRSSEHVDALAAEFQAFGAGEARRGHGLERLYTGMRTTTALAWRRLVDHETLVHDHMAVLGEAIFAFQEEVSTAASEGHARARGADAEASRRRRTRLLEALLDEPGSHAVPTLARAARWRIPERVAVALLPGKGRAPVDPPGKTAGPARAAAPDRGAWSEAGGSPAPLGAPGLPSDVLTCLDRPEPCALVPDPEGPGRLRALERSFRGSCAVLGPSVPLDRAPVSLARARDLVELVRTGVVAGGGVVRWDDHLPALLLSRDTELVARMARARLLPLARLRPPQRERMADTLLAWLESGLNASEAAERLRVHPQTVRYRMRRLEELFGARLREPEERFELELVLRARRLLGPVEEGDWGPLEGGARLPEPRWS